jgi:hypothetical protein
MSVPAVIQKDSINWALSPVAGAAVAIDAPPRHNKSRILNSYDLPTMQSKPVQLSVNELRGVGSQTFVSSL